MTCFAAFTPRTKVVAVALAAAVDELFANTCCCVVVKLHEGSFAWARINFQFTYIMRSTGFLTLFSRFEVVRVATASGVFETLAVFQLGIVVVSIYGFLLAVASRHLQVAWIDSLFLQLGEAGAFALADREKIVAVSLTACVDEFLACFGGGVEEKSVESAATISHYWRQAASV